ncbi:hypothetical protein KQX54_016703 [Cotesia glomerata]|uniref:Uncharacterized protein n=1 Tax=Cotesia glomerata TaxID=32391 RepID=A0AAV7J743_COTGL|nr:hypothetical protein KQX54_016703 [Cotesia glomerata]
MNKVTMNEQNDKHMLDNNETEDTPSETSDKNLKTGDIVLFKPYIQSSATVMRRLEELRKEYVRPTNSKKMKLVGLVHFYPPTLSREGIETRKKNEIEKSRPKKKFLKLK